jgi:CRISPR system Cascade subunit CasA
MTYSFNLIDQKWIPCVDFDGRVEELSLIETLAKARHLRSIHGDSPLETAALYRLMLAVLHSALRGPKSKSEWVDFWERDHWELEGVKSYLNKWYDHFDLFHPKKPFYQARDERAKSKSVITLVMDMASGNNAALFDHHTESEGVSLSSAKAARTLVVSQTFGLAGLFLPGATFTDAPWGRGALFFLEGEHLYQTLVLNLLPYPDDDVRPTHASDKPSWEQDDPYAPDRQIPHGYLDYLTWQSRRILLTPEGEETHPVVRSMTMAPGLRLDASILDPMKAYRQNEKKDLWLSIRFVEERAMWRDSGSFMGLKTIHGRPPQPLSWLPARLDEVENHKFRLMALGMANDQAKVEFFREDHLPLRLEYLNDEDLMSNLRNALDLAEKTRFCLKIAIQWMALLIISPKSDGKKWQEVDRNSKDQAEKLTVHWNSDRFYWRQLEIPFLHFLEELPDHPEALHTWKEVIRQTAWSTLELTANLAGTDAPALKAAVRARDRLGYLLKELFSENGEEATA